MPTLDLDALQLQRDQLKSQLSQIGGMRPGSLVARFRKCGKPSCHCAKNGAQGHGPSYSLTRPVAGKTVTRIIPAAGGGTNPPAVGRIPPLPATGSATACRLRTDLRLATTPRHTGTRRVKKTSLDGLLAAEILWDIEALLGRQSLEPLDLEALESAVRRQALGAKRCRRRLWPPCSALRHFR